MTIKQRTAHITIENGPALTIRRMAWKPAREFLSLLSRHAAALAPALAPAAGGDLGPLLARAAELVAATDELSAHIIVHSAGLSREDADTLDYLAALEVLRAALELNLGDELKNSLSGIRAALAALFPRTNKTNATGNSTPGLLMPDTPPTGSTAAPSSTST
jgi:hypothetical protein